MMIWVVILWLLFAHGYSSQLDVFDHFRNINFHLLTLTSPVKTVFGKLNSNRTSFKIKLFTFFSLVANVLTILLDLQKEEFNFLMIVISAGARGWITIESHILHNLTSRPDHNTNFSIKIKNLLTSPSPWLWWDTDRENVVQAKIKQKNETVKECFFWSFFLAICGILQCSFYHFRTRAQLTSTSSSCVVFFFVVFLSYPTSKATWKFI